MYIKTMPLSYSTITITVIKYHKIYGTMYKITYDTNRYMQVSRQNKFQI